MLKKIKLKNSTILLIGISIILLGVVIGGFEYFTAKKNKAFSKMNVMLYKSEIPEIKDNDVIDEENTIVEETPTVDNTTKYNYVGILEIPKINLKQGFVDLSSKYNNVDYNIAVISGSTFPDKKNNNLILAAHSGICSVCYFDNLYKLNLNDKAYIYYNDIKYEYKISNIYEVEKNGTVTIYRDNNKNTLTLITCTRNSDTKQTVYILEQIN